MKVTENFDLEEFHLIEARKPFMGMFFELDSK